MRGPVHHRESPAREPVLVYIQLHAASVQPGLQDLQGVRRLWVLRGREEQTGTAVRKWHAQKVLSGRAQELTKSKHQPETAGIQHEVRPFADILQGLQTWGLSEMKPKILMRMKIKS